MSATITNLLIADIKVQERFRRDLGDLTALAASIEQLGLLHPIIVATDHSLIVGRRRLAACAQLGQATIPARVIDLDDPLGAEYDENEERKAFDPSERVHICEAIEAREQQLAKQRKHEGQKSGGRGKKKLEENFSSSIEAGQTRDVTARAVGMGWQAYQKAKCVVKAGELDPDNYGRLVEGMDHSGKIDPYYRQLPRELKLPSPDDEELANRPRKRLSFEAINLKLDRFCHSVIVPNIPHFTDEDMEQLRAAMRLYADLNERVRKDAADAETTDVVDAERTKEATEPARDHDPEAVLRKVERDFNAKLREMSSTAR